MPAYNYRAVDFAGRVARGSKAAANEWELAQNLNRAGFELIEARPKKEAAPKRLPVRFSLRLPQRLEDGMDRDLRRHESEQHRRHHAGCGRDQSGGDLQRRGGAHAAKDRAGTDHGSDERIETNAVECNDSRQRHKADVRCPTRGRPQVAFERQRLGRQRGHLRTRHVAIARDPKSAARRRREACDDHVGAGDADIRGLALQDREGIDERDALQIDAEVDRVLSADDPLPLPGFEIERINVLIFLRRIFRVLNRAIRTLAEPFRVFTDPWMIR